MVDDGDAVGCRVAPALRQVGSQYGVVDGIDVGGHRVPTLGVVKRLATAEGKGLNAVNENNDEEFAVYRQTYLTHVI